MAKISKKTLDDAQSQESLLIEAARVAIGSSMLEDAQHTLVHIEDSHYKFYQLKLVSHTATSEWDVEICYGKIGTAGVFSYKRFNAKPFAEMYLRKLRSSKLMKGYQEPDLNAPVKTVKTKASKKMTAEGLEKLEAFLNSLK